MIDKKLCDEHQDNDLVALSIVDSRYFYCLMKRYEDKLVSYIRRLTYLPGDDVADVVENSFIKAFTHLNDCDCKLKFSSWIYRITHNEAINWLKKNKQPIKLEIDEEADEFVSWLVSDTNIEKEAMDERRRHEFEQILLKLKPEYKEVLVLRFFEDRGYLEISDILQKPMGTVATLLSRAKKQFKEEYEKNN